MQQVSKKKSMFFPLLLPFCQTFVKKERKVWVQRLLKENFSTSFYFELQSKAPLLLRQQCGNTRKRCSEMMKGCPGKW